MSASSTLFDIYITKSYIVLLIFKNCKSTIILAIIIGPKNFHEIKKGFLKYGKIAWLMFPELVDPSRSTSGQLFVHFHSTFDPLPVPFWSTSGPLPVHFRSTFGPHPVHFWSSPVLLNLITGYMRCPIVQFCTKIEWRKIQTYGKKWCVNFPFCICIQDLKIGRLFPISSKKNSILLSKLDLL